MRLSAEAVPDLPNNLAELQDTSDGPHIFALIDDMSFRYAFVVRWLQCIILLFILIRFSTKTPQSRILWRFVSVTDCYFSCCCAVLFLEMITLRYINRERNIVVRISIEYSKDIVSNSKKVLSTHHYSKWQHHFLLFHINLRWLGVYVIVYMKFVIAIYLLPPTVSSYHLDMPSRAHFNHGSEAPYSS